MPDTIPDGVYYALDEATYHADPALGSTDHVALSRDPYTWQWRRLHPEDRADSPALTLGSAVHKLLLEGVEAFDHAFPAIPRQSDYPDALVTVDDVKAYAAEHGISLTGATTKAAMVKAIRARGHVVATWDGIKQAFEDHAERCGGKPIDAEQRKLAMTLREFALSNEAIAGAFTDGCPEVSVFWTGEDGLRLKARFDFLKIGATVDLKTFSVRDGRDPQAAIAKSIAERAYHVQCAHYHEARFVYAEHVWGGLVHDECPMGKRWQDKAAQHADPEWVWVFTRTDGMPLAYARRCGPRLFAAGHRAVQRARANFTELASVFGERLAWLPPADEAVPVIDMADLPRWFSYAEDDEA